jgi:type II secretion system (T2SS) protein E
MPRPRIGELLIAQGFLAPGAVHRALGFQKAAGRPIRLGSILLSWDLIDEESLLKALAAVHRCEAVTSEMLANVPLDIVRMLPAQHALRLNALPYALFRSSIRAAFVNPSDLDVIDRVTAITGRRCVPGVVTELRLLQAHRRYYGRSIPLEFRRLIRRSESLRTAGAEPRAGAPVVRVPVLGESAANRTTAGTPPISIPEFPRAMLSSGPRRDVAASANPVGVIAPKGAERADRHARSLPNSAPSATVYRLERALASVSPEIPRLILLAPREGLFVGWRARGLEAAALQAVRIPGEVPSVFASVARSGTHHFGSVSPELWPESLRTLIDGPPPCGVFAIHSGRGVVALLYGDRRGKPMKFEDTARLARAAAEIAAVLAKALPETPR